MLELGGQVRSVVSLWNYVPKNFVAFSSHKGFMANHPDVVRRAAQAMLKATAFIKGNPDWTIEKMKTSSGYSTEAATAMYKDIREEISADGKIDADLVKRLIIFSIDNGLGQKEKMPAAGELYTKEFTG